MAFEWLDRIRRRGSDSISSTQGSASYAAPDKRERERIAEREQKEAEEELEQYKEIKAKIESDQDIRKSEGQFVEEYEEKLANAMPNMADFEKVMDIKDENVLTRIVSMLVGRLIPSGKAEDHVVGYDGSLTWVLGLPSEPKDGDITYYSDNDSKWITADIGSSGEVLGSDGTKPVWTSPTGLPSCTIGQILYADGLNSWVTLPVSGYNDYVLENDGTDVSWAKRRVPVPTDGYMLYGSSLSTDEWLKSLPATAMGLGVDAGVVYHDGGGYIKGTSDMGSSGEVLSTDGTKPVWTSPTGLPSCTIGQILYADGLNSWAKLPISGYNDYVLENDGTDVSWAKRRVPAPTDGYMLYGDSSSTDEWLAGKVGTALGLPESAGLVHYDNATGAFSILTLPNTNGLPLISDGTSFGTSEWYVDGSGYVRE